MTGKEFLEQVRYVDRAIDSKLEQLQRLEDETKKATSIVSDMPRSCSPNLQRLEATIVKIVDLKHEINRDIDRLVDMKKAARVSINGMTNLDERLILELRYLCYKSWPEITEQVGCGESNIYRIHGHALTSFMPPDDLAGCEWSLSATKS